MTLREYRLNQLGISTITDKAIEKFGTGDVAVISARMTGNLDIVFEVQSSTDDNKHVDLKGNFEPFLQKGYAVTLSFLNVNRILPKDWQTKNQTALKQMFKNIFDKCDVKIHCDCPAFYWQGMQEEDDKKHVSYFDFSGQRGKGIWSGRHMSSGGISQGQQMCKHIWAVEFKLLRGELTVDILNKLGINATNVNTAPIQQPPKSKVLSKKNAAEINQQQQVNESTLFENILIH